LGNSCYGEDVSPTLTIVSPEVTDTTPTVTIAGPLITDLSLTATVVSPTVTEICTELDIAEIISRPQGFEIDVFPNPFNSSVRISLGYGSESAKPLSASPPGACRVEIFDINGRMVYAPSPSAPLPKGEGGKTLLPEGEGDSESRMRAFIWTPDESINSGVYLVRATAGEQTTIKRVVYLK